jgi:hypothetical protein
MHSIGNEKIISGAEINDTIYATFCENQPYMISDTSIVCSLISMPLKFSSLEEESKMKLTAPCIAISAASYFQCLPEFKDLTVTLVARLG